MNEMTVLTAYARASSSVSEKQMIIFRIECELQLINVVIKWVIDDLKS